MPRYNHAFDFAFEVKTDNDADNVTPAELRAALIARAQSISDSEIMEACGCFDTMDSAPEESRK